MRKSNISPNTKLILQAYSNAYKAAKGAQTRPHSLACRVQNEAQNELENEKEKRGNTSNAGMIQSNCIETNIANANANHAALDYEENYFEILGFEQSSAMQIVSSYATQHNILLKLANSTFKGAKSTTISYNQLAQEYGIIACGNASNLAAFFAILESLFGAKLLRGNLAGFTLQKLAQNGYTLCVAESCTGGTLSASITAIDGASAVFKGGITAYSIESKQRILGVKDSIFREHGVYSEACVCAMARGALDLFGADVAIATSGLATPDMSANNFLRLPAGMVFTCVLIRDRLPISIAQNHLTQSQPKQHSNNAETTNHRLFVQQSASMQALRLLLSAL